MIPQNRVSFSGSLRLPEIVSQLVYQSKLHIQGNKICLWYQLWQYLPSSVRIASILTWFKGIFFFFKFLEDMSPFCGATDTPVLDFWWRLLWVSKPEWFLAYSSLAEAYVLHYTFPEIHLWCNTCQPLGGPTWQLSHLFHIPVRHWWDSKPGAIMLPLTVWDQADALPTELSWLSWFKGNLLDYFTILMRFSLEQIKNLVVGDPQYTLSIYQI